jgi:outer membrane protein assembly factor BamB
MGERRTAVEVSIDLGELGREDAATGPGPLAWDAAEPEWSLPARWAWNRARRLLLCLGVVVLAGLTMSASRPSPGLVEVATIRYDSVAPGSQFVLAGDAMYLRSAGEPATLVGYRLSDGARLWRVPLAAGDEVAGMRRLAGNLFTSTGRCPSFHDSVLLALDERTGGERWRRPGRLIGLTADGVLIATPAPDTGCNDVVEVLPVQLRLLDPASGQTRWSLPDILLSTVQFTTVQDGTITDLVAVDRTGAARSVDVVTGRVTATAQLPEAVLAYQQRLQHLPGTGVSIVAGLLIAGTSEGGSLVATAYSPKTLQRRWSQPITPTPPVASTDEFAWYFDCGRLLCLRSSTGTVAVDPATGGNRWRLPGVDLAAGTDRWLLMLQDLRTGDSLRVVDSGTGSIVTAAAGYASAVASLTDRWLVAAFVWQGTTAFEILDLTNREHRFLGRVPGRYDFCQLAGDRLVCIDGTSTMWIWRIEA